MAAEGLHYDQSTATIHMSQRMPRTSLLESRPMKTTRGAVLEALERGEFYLVYQPIVDLLTRRTVGLEALVRWLHPSDGELGPDTFIEQFERNGAIADLGVWVTRTAMAEASEWHRAARAKDRDLYLSVNVSGYELQQLTYSEALVSTCGEFEHRCQDLRVEVIESDFDLAGPDVHSNLATLRGESVRLVIDDFGTGASTIERILEVGADAIKLDRTLIADLEENPDRYESIVAVVAAAELAGVEVVAEGIERESQYALLLKAGCRFGQGYLFSRPVRAADVPSILDV